jgi:geranylgeranyl diphosphate synthase type II
MSDTKLIEDYLRTHFSRRNWHGAQQLKSAVEYSLFNGGKRFRPMVAFLTADALGLSRDKILPFAAAVEMVHTYSLIHDDLPCMDNDDMRRGQPTNHRVYGEALALLAGDALLTEAFFILGEAYKDQPQVGLQLVRELGEAAGLSGMVGGQVLDIAMLGIGGSAAAPAPAKNQAAPITLEALKTMQALKTGALILVAARGAAIVAASGEEALEKISDYGRHLGLAFQLADDILDYNPEKAEASGYPALIGVAACKDLLETTSQNALRAVEGFDQKKARGLRELIEKNKTRQV